MKLRVMPVTAVLVALAAAATIPSFLSRSAPPGKVLAEDGHPRLRRHGPESGPAVGSTQGKLPNLKRADRSGRALPAGTTHSPESPTAWASFATGVNPGKHNIYDFLVRDTATYLPDLGMVRREPPRFLFGYVPIAKPKVTLDPRRHVVLGHGRPRRRALQRAHRAGHVPARRRPARRAARRACRCRTSAAPWARSITSRPT